MKNDAVEQKISLTLRGKLKELDLSHTQLDELPESIGQLTQLQSLNLSHTQLKELPESLGQLTQLQSLDLSHTQLKKLPKSLGQLTQLHSLGLSGIRLTELPESLGQLTQMKRLDLAGNGLKELPKFLLKLTKLEVLDLGINQLMKLPESLGRLEKLENLELKYNGLRELPESLGRLAKLQRLSLSANQLCELPEIIWQLTNLNFLHLCDNQLKEVSESLGHLAQLRGLALSSNQLTKLPESLGQLTNLRFLVLDDNRLTKLPESLGQLTQLQLLDLTDNRLTKLPESVGRLKKLEVLNLRVNQLAELPESLRKLTNLIELSLRVNQLTKLPECLWQLKNLKFLHLNDNRLTELPETLGKFTQLEELSLHNNELTKLPESVGRLKKLETLDLRYNQLVELPESLSQLTKLHKLDLDRNQLTELPASLGRLRKWTLLNLDNNPLNPTLSAAYKEGIDSLRGYLRAQAKAKVTLYEAKLILVGEGEVGKSCLLGALRGDQWVENRPTTHGIEIKPVTLIDRATDIKVKLKGWDFGGQRIYRPTHQLFFSSPAVYLVVWKPRAGLQQGFVREWIRLVKHREPDAKILVVSTHGGPKESQPDINRQDIWDLFGKETVVDFFSVDSKPNEHNERLGIEELKRAIARVAAGLPDMGRTFPKNWQEARTTLSGLLSLGTVSPLLKSLVHDVNEAQRRIEQLDKNRLCINQTIAALDGLLVTDESEAWKKLSEARLAWLPLGDVLAICKDHGVEEHDARIFIRICQRVGDLIYYEHDPILRDIVVLKPDWLATAISFVLDDRYTRNVTHGLISFDRLGRLWSDPERSEENRYPPKLYPVFLRLMERFDLSYRVADVSKEIQDSTSLIAQLVPDLRPQGNLEREWPSRLNMGDKQQVQICRIVENTKNQSATAEGIFCQLIVRLQKYSLGYADYTKSIHWKKGLVLKDDYGALAFLEYIANDIRISVRSPYPERFLSALTYEVKWLVENFWEGLRCEVSVPCLMLQRSGEPCSGLFDVKKLLENKSRNRPEQPCPICNEWQSIEQLLHNASAVQPSFTEDLLVLKEELAGTREQLRSMHKEEMSRFDKLDLGTRKILIKVDDVFRGLMTAFTDEAKEGPRLFSIEPVDPSFLDRPKWISKKFRVTLWCEHSRLPLPMLNENDEKRGVYELDLPRDWLIKAAPILRKISNTLSLVLPVASSATKFILNEETYKRIEKQLDLGQKSLDLILEGREKVEEWLEGGDAPEFGRGTIIKAGGAELRELQDWLKKKDPSFGGLSRVQNKRNEFLWVHSRFENEY